MTSSACLSWPTWKTVLAAEEAAVIELRMSGSAIDSGYQRLVVYSSKINDDDCKRSYSGTVSAQRASAWCAVIQISFVLLRRALLSSAHSFVIFTKIAWFFSDVCLAFSGRLLLCKIHSAILLNNNIWLWPACELPQEWEKFLFCFFGSLCFSDNMCLNKHFCILPLWCHNIMISISNKIENEACDVSRLINIS